MKKILFTVFRILLSALSLFVTASALYHTVLLGFGPVPLFMLTIALPFLAATLFTNRIKALFSVKKADKPLYRLIKYTVLFCFCAVFVVFGCFSAAMLLTAEAQPPSTETDCMLILGCKVEDRQPSLMLQRRLDTAAVYLLEHPDVIVVVSGGIGNSSAYSEASVMRSYLIGCGVAANRILTEDLSTNTQENLQYSAELLQNLSLSQDADVLIVTDGFHQLRARIWAEKFGFTNLSSLSSSTPLFLFPYYFFREFMGLTRYFLLGF